MKKVLVCVLSVLLALSVFSACGKSGGDGIDYLVLVNKQHKLPEGWEDAVELEDATNTIPDGVELNEDNDYLATDVFKVEKKALKAFRALQAELEKEGVIILLDSTYRSVARQEELWSEFEEAYGLEYTQNTVAVPGTSEHHTGLAIDVCIIKDGAVINENDAMIAEREIFSEIHAKLADYGFILRFPEDGKAITGYGYEPWHFRYIDSPEIAKEIMDKGETLEEYLGAVPAADPADTAADTPLADAEYIPDLTVQTIDGGTFTLSEALKDHELVLINLFFTNCPPCKMEFPFLQEAWAQNADRVAVIALTPDPDDTDEVLRSYADELGLTFPIAHEEGTGLYERYVTTGFPTTLLVDRTGKVALSECGALTSTEEFVKRFDDYTGEDYDPNVCTYTVYCYGAENNEDVEGVVINFCTDTACTPVTSAAQGAAVFTGPPAKYHVQIVKIPEGWELAQDAAEWDAEPFGEVYWIPFTATGK